MAYLILFVLGFLLSLLVQRMFKVTAFSLLLPSFLFIGYILFSEFALPYSGGGASMWPIALLFGVPTLLFASGGAVLVAKSFGKP